MLRGYGKIHLAKVLKLAGSNSGKTDSVYVDYFYCLKIVNQKT